MGEQSKYHILYDDSVIVNDKYRVYRIQADRSFGNVKAGDLGGYVGSENNLSHDGSCWIYDEAKAFGRARVLGNAAVTGISKIYDEARICENAVVNNVSICEYAVVLGNEFIDNYLNKESYDTRLKNIRDYAEADMSDFDNISDMSNFQDEVFRATVYFGCHSDEKSRTADRDRMRAFIEVDNESEDKPYFYVEFELTGYNDEDGCYSYDIIDIPGMTFDINTSSSVILEEIYDYVAKKPYLYALASYPVHKDERSSALQKLSLKGIEDLKSDIEKSITGLSKEYPLVYEAAHSDKEMTLYNVSVETVGHSYISVEAESEKDAMNRVQESGTVSKIDCGELENVESTAVEAYYLSPGMYDVHIETVGHFSMDVKAESKQEAMDKVQESDDISKINCGELENIESLVYDASVIEDSYAEKFDKNSNQIVNSKTVSTECQIAVSRGMGR